jgi:hypothetical protein
MKWIALAIVALHALVLREHDLAHRALGVTLNAWQEAFIYPVIVVAPVVAATLLFTRYRRVGFILLAASMFGSFAFGVFHHYVAISPDHVSHLPVGSAQPAFRLTAFVMAAIEAIGTVAGLVGLRSRNES